MITLQLMGREYCSLCQIMLDALDRLNKPQRFTVQWIDIDDDDTLEEKYGALVPALIGAEEEVVCFYHLNLSALDAYLGKIR